MRTTCEQGGRAPVIVTQLLALPGAGRLGAPQLTSGQAGAPMREGRA